MIYLDNAATTPVFEEATQAAQNAMRDAFFNPNATYKQSVSVKSEIENNRRKIADAVGASPEEIFFTSCATESNNWALECGRKNKKGNVVISAGEHASVYETAMKLKNRGVDVRIAPLLSNGEVDDSLIDLVDENTTLVSCIHVSNETGVVNPIKSIAKAVKSKAPNAIFHSDGVQGVLKTGERIDSLGVDLYSASAHKLGAPKGIGFLYVRRGVNIAPFIFGGGQEKGIRSGTQNTPYIAAFASAVECFKQKICPERLYKIHDALCDFFIKKDCKLIGVGRKSGYILCVHVPKVKAEILQNTVSEKGVIIGKGAACSGSKRGNRVLSAMGLKAAEIECCIRISISVDTTVSDALDAAKIIIDTANIIRSGNVG